MPSYAFVVTRVVMELMIDFSEIGSARSLDRDNWILFPVFGSVEVPSVIVGNKR